MGLIHGFGDKGLDSLEPGRHRVDEPLLLVQDMAQIFDDSLQIAVAHFDFG